MQTGAKHKMTVAELSKTAVLLSYDYPFPVAVQLKAKSMPYAALQCFQ